MKDKKKDKIEKRDHWHLTEYTLRVSIYNVPRYVYFYNKEDLLEAISDCHKYGKTVAYAIEEHPIH